MFVWFQGKFCVYRLNNEASSSASLEVPEVSQSMELVKAADKNQKVPSQPKVKLRLADNLPLSKVRECQVIVYVIRVRNEQHQTRNELFLPVHVYKHC